MAAFADEPADPVLAKVDGVPIRLSDVKAEAARLPANLQALPPATLYPMLLTRMIDARALVVAATRAKMQDDPAVRRQLRAAREEVLENAILTREVKPQLSEAALHALYDKTIAGKPGAEQVHARHILVPTKAEAEKIIAELGKGADFAALAKKYSKDPGAANGGDLGFFSRAEMVPEFATAAFALKPGEYTKTPVHTQFGWHVIQVLAKRRAPAPTFAEAEAGLRQKVLKAAVEKAVAAARKGVKVETFPKALPQAAPPAAPAAH
ncbi:MAG: peptidylprolyl isomerase [Rhodospirillales bacterium]|nr:peptidylprolyl isomerase [Rhodospirillales bacterium]